MSGSQEFARAVGLLCLVAHPEPDLDRIRDLLRSGLDHALVRGLAEAHGVRPQLIRGLASLSWEFVPDRLRRELEAFQHRHLLRTLNLAQELLQLSAQFARHGIACFSFKGPVLAIALYEGLADRDYIDLDIMVASERMADAEQLLLAAGYHCPDGDPAFRRAFLAGQRQYTFLRDSDGLLVDLHWEFKGRHVPFPLDAASAWNDLRRLPIGDRDVATLSEANRALLLAGHGTKEAWRLLKWIGDFGRLVHRCPDLDWREVHRRARQQRSGNSILLACAMAEQVLDVPVPRTLASLVASNTQIAARVRSFADRLRLQPPPQVAPHFVDLDLCDDRLGKFKARLSLVIMPTAGDYHALPLPQLLWPAYYLTRPFRLAANAAAATFGRRSGR